MNRKIEAEKDARRQRTAEEILDALKASGMSRKEFALKMGRQPSEVTKWLSGKHNFTSDLLAEISVVLSSPISGARDITIPMHCVDGYELNDSAHSLHDSGYMIDNIDLPTDIVTALIDKAGNAGMSLREYVRALLAEKAAEKSVSA
ncbi:MAG: multiprotein-bridging factor 1 family protein, partial [Candidatus Cryptobacteroides sp.]